MTRQSHRRFRHDDEERRKWQDPEVILNDAGLGPGQVFVDLGSGEGFFALPAARIVGETGRVYALDIDSDAVQRLSEAAQKVGLENVITQAAAGEATVMCESCADIVFFGIDLHDFDDPEMVLRNSRLMIKPDGKLIDIDWKKEPMPLGPPLEIRFDEQKACRLIEEAGFEVESVKELGRYHYVIVARPI